MAGIIMLAGCKKGDGPAGNEDQENEKEKDNVQLAINAIDNKFTETDITISGELSKTEWETLKQIRIQLPMVESITLSDVKAIDFGVFVYKEGIYSIPNKWLKKISAPKVERVGKSAFWSCEKLETVNFPKLKTAKEEAFCACDKLKALDFPNLTNIEDRVFSGCNELISLKLGSSSEIKTTTTSFEGLNVKNIDLSLGTHEASQAIGKIWKDQTWKSISNNDGVAIPDPDFGVANFGCTKDFVIKHETRKTVPGGVIYEGVGGSVWWYIYDFDKNDRFISGTIDYSHQFPATPTDLVFTPIEMYVSDLNDLKNKFGNPTYASEDVFSFNMTDKEYQPGYAWYESQAVMNKSKRFTYRFSNSTTNVESVLSFYLRKGQYQTWGFTIRTTYSQK